MVVFSSSIEHQFKGYNKSVRLPESEARAKGE